MSDEQKDIFVVPQVILSIVLIAAVFGSLAFTLLLVVVQTAAESRRRAKLPLLKILKSRKEVPRPCVELDLPPPTLVCHWLLLPSAEH